MQRIIAVLALALALVVALPGLAAASDDPFFSEQWGLDAIGAETAWNQGRGAGVTIAVGGNRVASAPPRATGKQRAGERLGSKT
ncbi:MAG: type VII secretion-associated serine protease mycosin, partial [Acidimicrobiales bacterium]